MSKEALIQNLKTLLANSYALYLKTHNYHWNVTGPNFKSLHDLFEIQYTDLALAVDDIAERIRTVGAKAPGAFSKYAELTSIAEGDEETKANDMVKDLAKDQDKVIKSLNAVLKAAQDLGDEATIGLAVDRITVHEKNQWMLQSSVA